MNQNYFGGFFPPAVAGLFFFMKKPHVEQTYITHFPSDLKETSGLTGVAKYLENKERIIAASKELELSANKDNIISKSGVAKYLEKHEQFKITGVTKYTLRKTFAERESKQNEMYAEVTGVAKYLKNQKDKPTLSSVARYIKHQESLPQASRVAKYITKQALLKKQSVELVHETSVARYVKQKENLPKISKVAKYLARQAIIDKKEKQSIVKTQLTGVAKYLKEQENLPQTSRVAKYMARQVIASRQKAVLVETGVDKYMRCQS